MKPCAFDRKLAERWHLYKPPARPSAGDVRIYQSFMRQPSHTLLLGATPEIRTLARRHGHALTAVDIEDRFYHALESLVDWPGGGKEEFVRADWLQMDLGREFDLVIGDGAINMIPPQSHATFLQRVAAHTRPGGLVLLHVHLWVEPRLKTPEEVFRRFREVQGDVYTATKGPLSVLWANRETGEMSNTDLWANLQELHERGITTADEHRRLGELLANNSLTLYRLKQARFEALAAKYFTVQEILTAGDYESHELKPIFCLRRKCEPGGIVAQRPFVGSTA